MKLKHKFKVGSSFTCCGIPFRIIVLVMLIPSMLAYYHTGFTSVNRNLPTKSGVVNWVHTTNTESGWKTTFVLEDDSLHAYSQYYETLSRIFLLFPPTFKVDRRHIHFGDTITFYLSQKQDQDEDEDNAFNDDRIVYTEGLIINGETIASPVVVSFTRPCLDTLGAAVGILFYSTIALFIADYRRWHRQKKNGEKLTEFFSNRNRFIQ